METFTFWFMKSVAELAFGIIAAFSLFALVILWFLITNYVVAPYKDYKEKKRWLSKPPKWVMENYQYYYRRKYEQYSGWKPWMQEVYNIKKQEVEDGKR